MKLSTVCAMSLVMATNFAFAATPEPLVLVKTIPLKGVAGKLDHLAIDSRGERLFVANKTNNTLDIVDLKAGRLVHQIADQGKVSGVDYAADLDMIYVGNGAGVCNAFQGQDYQLVFSTKANAADNVHYLAENKRVYVGQDEILSALDAQTGEIKAEIKLPGAVHGFKIDRRAMKIYGVLTKPNLLAVIDLSQNVVTNTHPLALSDAGSPIAQDAQNGLLFVGCPKKQPMVVVFDAKTGKEMASIAIPGGVDDVHFDGRRNRLYASCSDEALVVLEKQGERFEMICKLATPKDSRTCVWGAGKLYLGVPKQDGQDGPEIRIYEAHPVIEGQPAATN